ncbi:Na+/H+ antiporter subunit E [Sinomonas cyclohexanicum]|uniref:Na+/H+ antiporter subunit E n=1 Tax=Sinomonas cyclohexanicum TaxID=322009 RepID=A0ABN6FM59_SINCY|nr:Na+/H+ antiporter subunit E [Corynebacterium cyclohexanicum]BCT77734.1 Na+/H+ antiporter subunit E [Corynebacterium cyclohexanicum]
MRRPRTSLRIELPLLGWLVLVWAALWQDFSPGNLVFGALVALVVTRVFYLPPVELSGRFNVLHAVRYAFVFVWHVIVASVQLAWLAIAKGPRVRSAVVAVPLRSHADLMVTATGHVISLVPGSLVVDVDRANATLYVHYIDIEDAAGADRVRREVLGVEAELIRIMGTKEELALVTEEQHLDRMMSAEPGEGGIR